MAFTRVLCALDFEERTRRSALEDLVVQLEHETKVQRLAVGHQSRRFEKMKKDR